MPGVCNTVENFGTAIFGDNEFGQFINEINPLNLGLSDLFKSMNVTLNGSANTTTSNGNTTNNNNSTGTTNTSTSNTTTNTASTTNCDEDGCN